MPKVEHRKARKDYPDNGIKAGDMYYFWELKTGPRTSRTYRQLTPPRRDQLTTSEFYGAIYSLFDSTTPDSPEDVEAMAEELRNIGEETQSKFDNMPEGLQQGDTGQMLEERASACEEQAGELDTIAEEWREAVQAYETMLEEYEAKKAKYEMTVLFETWAEPCDDFDAVQEEPEAPDEVDVDDFISRVSECEPQV